MSAPDASRRTEHEEKFADLLASVARPDLNPRVSKARMTMLIDALSECFDAAKTGYSSCPVMLGMTDSQSLAREALKTAAIRLSVLRAVLRTIAKFEDDAVLRHAQFCEILKDWSEYCESIFKAFYNQRVLEVPDGWCFTCSESYGSGPLVPFQPTKYTFCRIADVALLHE
jgi:hypothetical protein